MKLSTLITCSGFLILLATSTVLTAGQEFKANYKQHIKSVDLISAVDVRQQNRHLFRRHIDIGVRAPIPYFGEDWSFGVHYRHIYTSNNTGGWLLEKRPYLQLQHKLSTNGNLFLPALALRVRSRQEFRFRQKKDDSKRHRLKITVKLKEPLFNIRPFISHEYYYDFLKDEVTKKSIETGFQFPTVDGVKLTIYYKYTSTFKNNQWSSYSAIVLKLSF